MKVNGLNLALTVADPVATFRKGTGEEPLDWQIPYLWEHRSAVVLKGRQVGASTSAGILACRATIARPRILAAIVSPSMKQSTEVKTRARGQLERLGVKLIRDSETVIQLENGSRILSLPGTAKSVRGWSADLLILDEAAFLDPETFLAARATVAATGGRIVVQSTPAGPFGHFHDLFQAAVDYPDSLIPGTDSPDPTIEWVRFRVSSEDVPTIDPDFLASERATLGEDDYAQEYLGRFSPAGMGLVDPMRLQELTQKLKAESDVWGKLR